MSLAFEDARQRALRHLAVKFPHQVVRDLTLEKERRPDILRSLDPREIQMMLRVAHEQRTVEPRNGV